MTWEDYKEETRDNIKEYIKENYDKEDLEFVSDRFIDNLRDSLFLADSVTGNSSGSYTCNAYEAEQNVQSIIWDDEFIDALQFAYGEDIGDCMKLGAEGVDVTARCLALDYIDLKEVINEVYEEMEEEECTS
ncbi:MAG: hypothetical protein II393_04175 [Cytophagales bacterium]|nr:hypothetical protein [Cytophagales bacterium]